ncbi:RED-like protein N-terminal region-domain-containing protein [Crucibulum laeve]|uniref:RED-like protein N-terminal region-domain-containing protein n=1 Tax=Crucibulum laeve TaxID=68775 RepID=A0A5C3M3P5_9AGAR|nr:RED-like protein N-terminal region-domain-containing protein [Crucibulum laeve]
MDQESFRKLLQTPHAGSSSTFTSRGSLLAAAPKSKVKTVDASQPAFKPRKVKKNSDLKYRDRAAERRVGDGNDYADVEAVLEDFEKRAADNEDKAAVEEQRRYLGGDEDHTILVKGLDMALVEQHKAKASMSIEDDDSLEQAFLEASSEKAVPKKRTREDIIRELKEKRGGETEGRDVRVTKIAEVEAKLLEEAKKQGKFKPIGFKPIGGSADGKKKKTKSDGKDGERKKKKRKLEGDSEQNVTATAGEESTPKPEVANSVPSPSTSKPAQPESQSEPADEDFDIFAGAGDYEGIDLGDDDDDEPTRPIVRASEEEEGLIPRHWIPTEDDGHPSRSQTESAPPPRSRSPGSRSPPPGPSMDIEEREEEEQPMRLIPLSSSAVPSIKELLAMDDPASGNHKKSKRKDKKKGGGGDDEGTKKKNAEAKAERDYKKLKSYTEKKAGASGNR